MTSTRSDERATFLADVLIGAVEGGTGYWAAVSGYRHSEDAPETTRATFHPEDEPPEAARVVTIDTIARGIGIIRRPDFKISADLRASILAASDENDAGDIDADAADAIVQAAIFGEIVYG